MRAAFRTASSETPTSAKTAIATFLKRRAIGLYVAFILAGGILSGYLYDLYLAIAG